MVKAIFFNILFIFALAATAFAEGDDIAINDYGKDKPKGYSFDNRNSKQSQSFSLRSGMYFKGENVINAAPTYNKNYADLNNNISFNLQNNYLPTYKKKVILNKLTFNPNELLRSYSGK